MSSCLQSVSKMMSVPEDTVRDVLEYWKLKRRSKFNQPLITPKNIEDSALAEAAESKLQGRLKMFTQIRYTV